MQAVDPPQQCDSDLSTFRISLGVEKASKTDMSMDMGRPRGEFGGQVIACATVCFVSFEWLSICLTNYNKTFSENALKASALSQSYNGSNFS